jgi:hypothetical protein
LSDLGELERRETLTWVGEHLPEVRRGFVGDLLYTLGWALWTGVVVVLFLQVLLETKRRQYEQALDAYEAGLRDEARTEGADDSGNDQASTRG